MTRFAITLSVVAIVISAASLFNTSAAPVAASPFSATPAIAVDAADADSPKGYALVSSRTTGGLWVHRDNLRNSPFAAVYSQDQAGAVVGLSRNQSGDGHDFAIVATEAEVYFQIRDEKGKFHFVPATALLKLVEKDKK